MSENENENVEHGNDFGSDRDMAAKEGAKALKYNTIYGYKTALMDL